jgi:hypothetical protein
MRLPQEFRTRNSKIVKLRRQFTLDNRIPRPTNLHNGKDELLKELISRQWNRMKWLTKYATVDRKSQDWPTLVQEQGRSVEATERVED